MRPLWSLKRLIHRYGYRPDKAIYLESLRRRYLRLGMRLARRQAPKPPIALITPPKPPAVPYVPMPRPQPPDWLSAILPRPQPPQVLHWPHGAYTRYYLSEHPHLRRQTGPLRKIDLVPEPTTDPINRLDTQPGIVEETMKVPTVKMQERHARREEYHGIDRNQKGR